MNDCGGFVTEIVDANGNETLQCRAMRTAAKLGKGEWCATEELDALYNHVQTLIYERDGVPF